MNILLINQYAPNKGDRAVAFFMIRELYRLGVDNVYLSTSHPNLWHGKLKWIDDRVLLIPPAWNNDVSEYQFKLFNKLSIVRSRFWRRLSIILEKCLSSKFHFLGRLFVTKRFYETLMGSDLVITVGGHHLTSILSGADLPFQGYEMAAVLACGKPLVLWSQSLGPMEFPKNSTRKIIRNILDQSQSVCVRDQKSLKEIDAIGSMHCNTVSTYESVFGLNDLIVDPIPPSQRGQEVGISIYSAQERSREAHKNYLESMVSLISYIHRKQMKVVFFPMEINGSDSDDRWLVDEIISVVGSMDNIRIVDDLPTPNHLLEVSKMRAFIGHKTHSIIIALTVATPLLAIAYHVKTNDFMEQYGLEENCLDDADLNPLAILEYFQNLEKKLDSVFERQMNKSKELCAQVKADFSKVVFG